MKRCRRAGTHARRAETHAHLAETLRTRERRVVVHDPSVSADVNDPEFPDAVAAASEGPPARRPEPAEVAWTS